jgi:hypothetical protein
MASKVGKQFYSQGKLYMKLYTKIQRNNIVNVSPYHNKTIFLNAQISLEYVI